MFFVVLHMAMHKDFFVFGFQLTCKPQASIPMSRSLSKLLKPTPSPLTFSSRKSLEMANSTTSEPSSTEGATDSSSGGDEVGPLSILPICVSLLAVVAIAFAACVFYRKRQRERAELLARQLRVTERRIDAVGSLWEKRERDVERKSTYYPPTDVRASASEPSVVTRPVPGGGRPHYVIRAYQPRLVPLPSSNNDDKLRARTSLVNSSACSCDYGIETCSMCKESEVAGGGKHTRRDASDGSLAVELATVPSVGSFSAGKTPSEHQEVIRRTKSETAATPGEAAKTRRSLQIESSLLLAMEATPTRNVLEWMEKSSAKIAITHTLPPPASLEAYAETEEYMSTVVTSTNEQEPPPNTPASRSVVTSVESVPPEKALSYVSEDAQSERWV